MPPADLPVPCRGNRLACTLLKAQKMLGQLGHRGIVQTSRWVGQARRCNTACKSSSTMGSLAGQRMGALYKTLGWHICCR